MEHRQPQGTHLKSTTDVALRKEANLWRCPCKARIAERLSSWIRQSVFLTSGCCVLKQLQSPHSLVIAVAGYGDDRGDDPSLR